MRNEKRIREIAIQALIVAVFTAVALLIAARLLN